MLISVLQELPRSTGEKQGQMDMANGSSRGTETDQFHSQPADHFQGPGASLS